MGRYDGEDYEPRPPCRPDEHRFAMNGICWLCDRSRDELLTTARLTSETLGAAYVEAHQARGDGGPLRQPYLPHDLTLQRLAESWHTLRFPDASPPLVLAKAIEELGEVASALIADIGLTSATGHPGDVPAECADVVVALLVLVARWYPSRNLLEEVRLKLHTLSTPGAHPASIT